MKICYSMIIWKNKKGNLLSKIARCFTLIEMLVVIAIISILASLLMPSLESSLSQSRSLSCASNLKQLGYAVSMYANDFNGYLLSTNNDGINTWFGWKSQIFPYIERKNNSTSFEDYCSGILECPEWTYYTGDIRYYGGYGWSNLVGFVGWGYKRRKQQQLHFAGKTVLIGDCSVDPEIALALNPSGYAYCSGIVQPSFGMPHDLSGPKHFDGFNYLWADNHANWQSRDVMLAGQDGGICDSTAIPRVNYYFSPKIR